MAVLSIPKRGEIYTVDFDRTESVLQKARPAIVIQNNVGNSFSPHTIVAGIREATERPALPVLVSIPRGVAGLTKDSLIDGGHLTTVKRSQLGRRWGRLPLDYERRLDEALRHSLDL